MFPIFICFEALTLLKSLTGEVRFDLTEWPLPAAPRSQKLPYPATCNS